MLKFDQCEPNGLRKADTTQAGPELKPYFKKWVFGNNYLLSEIVYLIIAIQWNLDK